MQVDSAELSLHPFAESTEPKSEETAKLALRCLLADLLRGTSLRDAILQGIEKMNIIAPRRRREMENYAPNPQFGFWLCGPLPQCLTWKEILTLSFQSPK
jgi:hypothetical protein